MTRIKNKLKEGCIMKFCPNCGSPNQDGVALCANCGKAIEAPPQDSGYRQPTASQLQDPSAQQYGFQNPQQTAQSPYHQAPQQPQYPQPQQQYPQNEQQFPPQQYPQQPPQQYPQQSQYEQQYPPQPPQQYPPQQPPQYPPQQPPQYPPQYGQQYQQQYTPYQDPKTAKYSKMGGWLLFCVIAMIIGAIVDPILSIGNILGDLETLDAVRSAPFFYPDGMETAAMISLIGEIGGLATIAFSILYLVNIFQRKANFLRFYQLGVLVSMLYTLVAVIVPSSIVGYEHGWYGELSNHIGLLTGNIGAFFLWTLYYCKSVRVRTYMGSDEYMDKAVFAYKNQPPLQ
jgi:hypothetical protein